MLVVAVKNTQKHRWCIAIFSTMFCYVTHVTLLLVLTKKNAPGGDLIRVDLIRFPGSIPGDK